MILEAKINLTQVTYKNIYTDYPEYIVLCKANVKLHPCILYINNKIVFTQISQIKL